MIFVMEPDRKLQAAASENEVANEVPRGLAQRKAAKVVTLQPQHDRT